jgi:hypothetical protein
MKTVAEVWNWLLGEKNKWLRAGGHLKIYDAVYLAYKHGVEEGHQLAMTEQRTRELSQVVLDRAAEQQHEHDRIQGTLVRRLTRSSHDDA